MHIVHAIFSEGFAGSERYCSDLCNMQTKDHTITVMLRKQSPRLPSIKQYLEPDIRVIELPRFFMTFWAFLWLLWLTPDLVHTHLGRASRCLGRAGAWAKIPVVGSLHIRYKHKDFHKHAGLICISSWQKQEMERYRGLSTVVHNWLPFQPEISKRDVHDLRQSWRANTHTFVFGSVGRLHDSKGMDLLIQAFRRADIANSRLVIVGCGEEEARLKKLAKGDERIVFAGHQSFVTPFYHAFDAFVSAARFEPFGLVLLEAMAAHCPLISTKTDGPKEFLQNQPATLVALENCQELSAALQQAARTGRKRQSYELSGFNALGQLMKIERFYRQVL